jgi:DNA-binding response OmpR family regulator
MARILIVDDEPSIVMAVRDELLFEGFEVDSATDGREAIKRAGEFCPDVLLLDLMLPGLNGFEVCRQLRADLPELWIIMLTVRGQEVDRVRGLELGADDYVVKPFSLRELVARIRVGLRRRTPASTRAQRRFGEIEVDLASHRVTRNGVELSLTKKEFEMLEFFLDRPGQVITRDEFLNKLWGEEVYVTHRVIDTHMAALRKKIENDANNPKHILSVRGVGYRLDLNSAES